MAAVVDASDPASRATVAIVGGGIAGLAAARALRRAGYSIAIYEAAPRAGGVIGSSRDGGWLHEHAANAVLSGKPDGTAALAAELGVEMVPAAAAARRRWIFVDGALRALPHNPLELIRSDLLTWRGKLALLREPLAPARPAGADESVFAFACRRLGPEAARTMVAPFVTGVFAGDAAELSVEAGFPRLAELDARGGLVRGSLSELRDRLRARRRGEPAAPRVRNRLCAPAAGMQELIDHLTAELADALRVDARVTALRRGELVLGEQVVAHDAIVLATPAWAAAPLVRAVDPALAATLTELTYAPAAIVHLGFDRAQVRHPLDGFGFLVAEGEELRLLGCVFESVLWPGRAPAGRLLLRCIFGGTRDPAALELDDDALVASARADLGRALGIEAPVVHRAVTRWPRAIAQYRVGHRDWVARAETAARPRGLVLAGAAYRGVAVNDCVADAARVVRDVGQVLARRAGGPALVLAAALGLATAGPACGGKRGPPGGVGDAAAVGAAADGAANAPPGTPPGTPAGAAPPYLLAGLDGDGRVAGAGDATIAIEWKGAPAALLRPGARNGCGLLARPALRVHTLHGVSDVVVWLEPVARGRAPAAEAPVVIGIRDCALDPVVAVAPRLGASLLVSNDDRRGHAIEIAALAAGDAAGLGGEAPPPLLATSLPLVGHTVEIPLAAPGIVRVSSDGETAAWVVAPPYPYVAITDEEGKARLDEIPAGTYAVIAWHAPILMPGEAAPRAPVVRGEITITAGASATATLSLAPGAPATPPAGAAPVPAAPPSPPAPR